jgi:hypothetical protein
MLERVFIHLFLFFYVFLVQTDMMDLLGSDLPVESDEGMKFSWSDGILLQVEMSCNESYCVLCFRFVFNFKLSCLCRP